MTWLIATLGSKVVAILGGAAAILLALFGVRWDAKRDQRKDTEIATLKANEKTRKDIEDAVEKSAAGGAAWRDRLRSIDND